MTDASRGSTIFCDDIRDEVGGKRSLIGTYNTRLFVQGEFPYLLPKFGFFITYFERPGVFEDDVIFSVYLPGDEFDKPTVTTTVPRSGFPEVSAVESTDTFPGSERLFRLDVPILVSPLIIKSEGGIRVRAMCDDNMTVLGGLGVQKLVSEEVPAEE